MSDEEPEELELEEVGVVVVFVGVGVDVDVFDGSGVSALVGVGVLVDVEVGAGGVVVLVELLAEVGAALEDELVGAEDDGSVGRARSRFAAAFPARCASSEFAAATEVFESCEAASALLRRPS